ncbi:hypothetical protein D3C76_1212900 [compost metagenome]
MFLESNFINFNMESTNRYKYTITNRNMFPTTTPIVKSPTIFLKTITNEAIVQINNTVIIASLICIDFKFFILPSSLASFM